MPGVYLKSIIMTLFPWALISLNAMFLNFFDKSFAKEKLRRFFLINLIIIEVIQPNIINTMIESMTCFKIDDEYVLKQDYYYQCYNKAHFYKV